MKKLIYLFLFVSFAVSANEDLCHDLGLSQIEIFHEINNDRFTYEEWSGLHWKIQKALYIDTTAMYADFSDYVTGDGSTDDTTGLQSALDSEAILVNDISDAIFKISSKIDLDRNGNQSIDWNEATVKVDVSSGALLLAMQVDKSSGKLTMIDLVLDGNSENNRGIDIDTITDLDNFEVKNQIQLDGQGIGIFGIRFNLGGKEGNQNSNAQGIYTITDLTAHSTDATANIEVGGASGSTNGVVVYWDAVLTNNTQLNITNLDSYQHWGSDSASMYTASRFNSDSSILSTSSMLTVNNGNFHSTERRRGKLFGGFQTFNNCVFSSPNGGTTTGTKFIKDNGGGGSCGSSGNFCEAGNVGIAKGENFFNNCTFNDEFGYDGRIIANNAIDIEFNNCTFAHGSDLAIFVSGGGSTTVADGDLIICSTEFTNGSSVYSYGDGTFVGTATFDTDNTYHTNYTSTTSGISSTRAESDLDCSGSSSTPTCSDEIQNGDETGVDCGGGCSPCSGTTTTNAKASLFLQRRRN